MSVQQILSAIFTSSALALFALHPSWESAVLVLVTCTYSAALEFFGRQSIAVDSDTQNQIKDLQNKVQALMLAKGMGR